MATTSRNTVADLAKGIGVLCMIQVHVVELLLSPTGQNSLLGRICLFLGGPPAAPVFLVLLGFFVIRSSRSTTGLLRRGVYLLGIALLLNVLRNAHLYYKIHTGALDIAPLPFLFGVDILAVAGLSVLLLAGIRPILPRHYLLYAAGAVCVFLATPFITPLLNTETPFRYLLALIGGPYAWSYFPIFPWLGYVLLGSAAACIPQQVVARIIKQPRQSCICLGIGVVLAATAYFTVPDIVVLDHYYRHPLPVAFWITGFLLFWFLALASIDHAVDKTGIAKWLRWLGRHITMVYLVQWVLIGNLATAIYQTQSWGQCLLWMVLITLATAALTHLINSARSPNA